MKELPIWILKSFTLLITLLFEHQVVWGQSQLLYKTVGQDSLYIEFQLPDSKSDQSVPLIVFYFGGGWNTGTIEQFRPHAEYFSKRGLATALVDYRVFTRHGTSPFASLRDAKSAIRFLRKNADSLGIDQDRIIAAGGSAGGQLAAATALTEGYNEPTDDLEISCKPNALILFNPVIDNGPAGYGYERIKEQYPYFSPLHNIRRGAPPTIILIGTEDQLIPVETIEYYTMAMKKVGSICELNLYEGQSHGFFNFKNIENYQRTIMEADLFIQSLGWLEVK
ncbi:alpha/beta hydrolase [Belliella aquatica]|uniref:Lipase n=1 Tax=Belliella aquatica TaxID=1323734 RepID=A0ABQ1N2J1_9BACT|nr:alpha/beta hydrolase [Belliella aquatica]MCH7407131.1 alpha/beta hydrolase [Belliella aquatica]GGC51885.1 lipase [Belliella aquatica]